MPVGDADYTIRARIVAEDATASGADSASRRLAQVEQGATRAGMSISGMLTRAFAVLGGAAGVGVAVRGMVGLNSEIQTAQAGLATLFTAMTGAPIASSVGIARKELQALRKDAAVGVGELSDYVAAFQGVLGPGLAAGKNTEQLRELTRNALAAGFALQGQRGLRNAPIDIQQALTSGAGDRITPIVSTALKAVGQTNEAFNKLTVAKRIDELNRAFSTFGPGVALMGQTWEAQFSTLTDSVKNLVRVATTPLFDRWTEGLRTVNRWLTANSDDLEARMTEWGGRLVATWDTLISRATVYAGILGTAALASAAPGLAGGAAAGAGSLAAIRAAVMSGAMAGSLRMGALAPGLAGAGAVGGGALGGLSAIGGILATLAAPALAVGVALTSVLTAIRNGGAGLQILENGLYRVQQAFTSAGTALDYLTQSGGAFDAIGQTLLATFGGLLYVVDPLIRGLGSLAIGLGLVLNVVTDGFRAMYLVATGDLAGASKISVLGRVNDAAEALGKVWANQGSFTYRDTQAGADANMDPRKMKVPQSVTNIGTVNMNVKTEVNADPARVMTAFSEGLDHIRVFGRGAKRIPALGV